MTTGDAGDLLADHHPVTVVRLPGPAELLADLQRVDARLRGPGEDLPIDPVFAGPFVGERAPREIG
jgi:hypothetical protein